MALQYGGGVGDGVGLGDGVGDGNPPIGVAVGVGEVKVIEKVNVHSGTGLPSIARGWAWGTVGATGCSSRRRIAVRTASIPSSRVTAPIVKNTQFFFKKSILFKCYAEQVFGI